LKSTNREGVARAEVEPADPKAATAGTRAVMPPGPTTVRRPTWTQRMTDLGSAYLSPRGYSSGEFCATCGPPKLLRQLTTRSTKGTRSPTNRWCLKSPGAENRLRSHPFRSFSVLFVHSVATSNSSGKLTTKRTRSTTNR
jgi:hypothetical protein